MPLWSSLFFDILSAAHKAQSLIKIWAHWTTTKQHSSPSRDMDETVLTSFAEYIGTVAREVNFEKNRVLQARQTA